MKADMSDRGVPIDSFDVTRAVASSQMVFTVGHVLTTGGFLYYFANALHPSALWFSVLLATPELSETCAVFTRPLVAWMGNRKRTWLIFYVLARVAALGIPAMAVSDWRPNDRVAFWILVASLALSHLFQSIAYTAYLSWLSDLAPRGVWGRFFALRRIAHVAVMVLLPAFAALLRRDWSDWTDDEAVRRTYLAVFLFGNACLWLSIVPLLRLPDRPVRWQMGDPFDWRGAIGRTLAAPALRLVLAASVWLAFAQGLTQAAFFRYQVSVLGLPLEAYLALSALMYALQIPWSWIGGELSDRCGDRWPLLIGLPAVSGALGFWMLARPGQEYWLIGAYSLWGLFGLINVCLRNLLLRTAPESDNVLPLAALEHVAGFAAGVSGLLGGYGLDRLLSWFGSERQLTAYMVLFACSWFGRATAALFLIPVPEPRRAAEEAV